MLEGLTFRNMFQLGFIVRDVDRAAEHIGKRFGIKKYRMKTHTPEVRTAHAYVGDTMFELIQVSANGPAHFVEYLPDDPSAAVFHHHAFRIFDGEEWQRLNAAADSSGLPTIKMTGGNGNIHVLYVDTRRELGFYCEYVHLTGEALTYYDDVPRN